MKLSNLVVHLHQKCLVSAKNHSHLKNKLITLEQYIKFLVIQVHHGADTSVNLMPAIGMLLILI